MSDLSTGSSVLDVGCGLGGTSRYLARTVACKVTGLTISGQQVKMAKELTLKEAGDEGGAEDVDGFVRLIDGRVRFVELDAEKMGEVFSETAFDCVWISEALSHIPDKELFFRNASKLLKPGGKLVVADWFKAEGLTNTQMETVIKPIESKTFPTSRSYNADCTLRWHASSSPV